MAVRTSAAGTYLSINSLSFSDESFTIMGWFYLVSDRNAAGHFFVLANAGGTRVKTVGVTSTGTLVRITSPDFTTVTGTNLSTGTWYHIALVANGTATTAYLNGVSDATTTDAVATTTFTQIFCMTDTASWVDARMSTVKMWTTPLTAPEILNEMWTIRPQRTANLFSWWPIFPGTSERIIDYSGNGHTLTNTGAVADEMPPPVSWGSAPRFIVAQPAGGTDVTVTPSQLLLTASLLTPTVSAVRNPTVTPSLLTLTLSLFAPTVTTATNVTVTPSLLTLTSSLFAPTVSAVQSPTITPGLLTLTSSLFTPTVTAGGNVTVSPALLTLTASLLQAFVTLDTTDLAEDGTVSEDVSVEIVTATASHRLPLLGVG